jgi:hypothetical protein
VIAIYHFFTFRLGFSSSLPHLTTMEDKRGTKRSHSPLKEGSSSPSSASMLLPSPSRSLPPPGSPPEVSSRCLRSPVFEQGGPSERISVVDLSSDEEDLFPNTSRDEEFPRKLFGNLNRGLLGSPGDGNIIILSDSNEEEEVREEDATKVDATPHSTVKFPALTVSIVDTDDVADGVQDDSNDSRTPDQAQNDNSDDGDEVGSPWAAAPKWVSAGSRR